MNLLSSPSKCALLRLNEMGVLEGFKKRIIVSDGGPGHFKVYKTQYWMSVWSATLRKKGISMEWNMYFANLGHNLCDGHAGKLKVYGFFSFLPFNPLDKSRKLKAITTQW